MRRREFITLIGAAAASVPLTARGQQPSKIPTIGLLSSSTAAIEKPRREAFVRRLAELGWIEGRTILIEDRSGEGSAERAGGVAVEFAQLKVDVMVIAGDAQGLVAKKAAPAIPIVLAAAGDPVGHGLVASLARPGGNVTGFSVQLSDTAGKRVELLHEAVPAVRTFAIFGNATNIAVTLELGAAEAAARGSGLLPSGRSSVAQRIFLQRLTRSLWSRGSPLCLCRSTCVRQSLAHQRFGTVRWAPGRP